jgi:hypothetical protein
MDRVAFCGCCKRGVCLIEFSNLMGSQSFDTPFVCEWCSFVLWIMNRMEW